MSSIQKKKKRISSFNFKMTNIAGVLKSMIIVLLISKRQRVDIVFIEKRNIRAQKRWIINLFCDKECMP